MADGIDTQVNEARAAYRSAEEKADAPLLDLTHQLVDTAKQSGQDQIALAREEQAAIQPFNAPEPHEQINEVMNGAPFLFALAAIGGKVSGAGGMAMLESLNGVSDGIIKGDQQSLQNHYQNYQAQYDKWKANADRTEHIYSTLAAAYAGSADGNIRALTAALNVTGDVTARKLGADDPAKWLQLKAHLEESNAKTAEAYAKIKQMNDSNVTPRMREIDAALTDLGVSIPGTRTGKVYWQRIQDLDAAHPGDDPVVIAERAKRGALGYKLEQTEMNVVGRREATIGAVQEAMNMPGGVWDQVDQAAKKVDFGKIKGISKARLASQEYLTANPDIQFYVSKVIDGRQELAALLSRTGMTTDQTRAMAEHALPLAASYEELQAARKANVEITNAIRDGNERYINKILKRAGVEELKPGQLGGAAQQPSIGGTPGATPGPSTQRVAVETGTSQSTGKTYVRYSDGSVSELGSVTSQ